MPTTAGLDPAASTQVLRLCLRIAANLLASGAQTDDVEAAIVDAAHALGVHAVQGAVTFSTIAVSSDAGPDLPPTTLLHIVHNRSVDFDRLAAMSTLSTRIRTGELDLAGAEEELDRIEHGRPTYGRVAGVLAPAVSAAGSTILFGGAAFEAAATLGIALLIQPALSALDRTRLPPFFRLIFGSAASALLVTALVALGLPVNGGIVLTGSLLRFLPGYALVSGFRDLIGESVISGTARLAEAILLAAAVASGTALALDLGSAAFKVNLSIITTGPVDWGIVVVGIAAFVAVGAYAVRLGVPPQAVAQAAILGAVGWLIFQSAASARWIDPSLATLVSAVVIGGVGRILARRQSAPAALWVVPAILPLLPGLQIVQAMLATTDLGRITGLLGATGTAFTIGAGVATGDIIVATVRRVRERIVAPAVDALAGGIDVLVVAPVGRAVNAAIGDRAGSRAGDGPPEQAAATGEPVPDTTAGHGTSEGG